ncbi:unnamed protein product, partial [Closterium sp. NIES-54]
MKPVPLSSAPPIHKPQNATSFCPTTPPPHAPPPHHPTTPHPTIPPPHCQVVDYRSDWHLNVTDPIAGNYYPITVGAFIKDKAAQLSVLVDRAAGAASLASGQMEVMLH